MITVSDDNDNLRDSSGEFTRASITKPAMPKDFTICAAYMVEAWSRNGRFVRLFTVYNDYGTWDSFVLVDPSEGNTQFSVDLGAEVHFVAYGAHVLFPLTWTRICVSLDTVTGNVRLVVDGEVIHEKVHEKAIGRTNGPTNLTMVFGYVEDWGIHEEHTGMISHLNMFSSPLSTARMVALTKAGGEKCGTPGDYVNWEEEDWKLTSKARIQMMDELQGPCRKESELTVFTADFPYHSAATNEAKHSGCIEHCEKLGKGRSPPLQTQEEWEWLRKEVHDITPDISELSVIWLAATDEEVEAEWRDAYPPYDQLNTSWAWPWGLVRTKDTTRGDIDNCLQWYTHWPDDESWVEFQCSDFNMGCLKDVS